jgi:hypothetical protein
MADRSPLRVLYAGALTLSVIGGIPGCSPASAVPHPIGATSSDTAAFYSWWVEYASVDIGPGGDTILFALPPGVRVTRLPLHSGYAGEAVRRVRPPLAAGPDWSTSVLHRWGSEALVAWVPTDSIGFYSSSPNCTRHATWLGVIPRGEWARLELVPYCSEAYGPDEVTLSLFHLGDDPLPHVEVSWNGPACIPSELYRYDAKTARYVLARSACAS